MELLFGAGCEIHLVILKRSGKTLGFDQFVIDRSEEWAELHTRCTSINSIELAYISFRKAPLRYLAAFLRHPYVAPFFPEGKTFKAIEKIITDNSPQLLWAEHLFPATLASQLNHNLPVVYSHHDWSWKIKFHRGGSQSMHPSQRTKFWLRRRHEENLVRSVSGCVSASTSESAQIRSLGARIVEYFPTTHTPVDLPDEGIIPSPPRIVHLGGMGTTANRIGLERFLVLSWPLIKERLDPTPELWVVGSLDSLPDGLRNLLDQPGIICTGFVPDLSKVLRPYDIHIVPWEYDTGTRTRIPLILNYSQVLVSTRPGASCIRGLEDGFNCRLVKGLQEMSLVIQDLYHDESVRMQLGQNGRETFLNSFTRQAIQPKFDDFLKTILSENMQ